MPRQLVFPRHWLILLILLLAAVLRFHNLPDQSFWNDEGNSARLSERSIRLILEGTASDIHPPLYYLILRGWRELVGESEFGLRSFSAFAGLATVAAAYTLTRSLVERTTVTGGEAVALFAALMTSLNPAMIYYSQETRMYALLAFLALLNTWLLWRWLRRSRRWPLAAGYVLCATAGLYTHYFYPATLLTHNLMVLGWLGWRLAGRWPPQRPLAPRWRSDPLWQLVRWSGLMLLTFLLYLPWFPIFLSQAQGRPAVYPGWLQFLRDSGHFMFFGPTISEAAVSWPWVAGSLLLALGLVNGWRKALLAVAGLLLPIAFMYAAGATQPEFFKFTLVSIPFLAMVMAFSWHRSPPKLVWMRSLLLFLWLILLWGNVQAVKNMYGAPEYARANYRGMAGRIAAEAYPNAGIILNAPNQWEVFTYYHRQGAPVYPLPIGRPSPEQIDAELNAIAQQHQRLYALFWGELQQDPEGLVERWLDTHTFKASDEWVGDVRFVTYAVPSQPSSKPETIAGWRFGDLIRLDGYTVASRQLIAGEIIQITLFWQTTGPIDKRYKVFLHLIDEQGQLIAQADGEPAGDSRPTIDWLPQEVVADNHGILIPIEAPPGQYTLRLGLYDLVDPADRLPITTPSGLTDSVELAAITIE